MKKIENQKQQNYKCKLVNFIIVSRKNVNHKKKLTHTTPMEKTNSSLPRPAYNIEMGLKCLSVFHSWMPDPIGCPLGFPCLLCRNSPFRLCSDLDLDFLKYIYIQFTKATT